MELESSSGSSATTELASPPSPQLKDADSKPVFLCGIPVPDDLEPHVPVIKKVLYLLFAVTFHVWLIWSIAYHATNELPIEWCNGLGFILVLAIITYIVKFIKFANARWIRDEWRVKYASLKVTVYEKALSKKFVRLGIYLGFTAIAVFYMCWNAETTEQYISMVGIFVFLFGGVLLSTHPKKIPWRIVSIKLMRRKGQRCQYLIQVFGGTAMQFVFALIIINVEFGRAFVNCLADKVTGFMAYTSFGSRYMYDWLITKEPFILDNLSNDSYAYEFARDINEVIFIFT